MDNLLSWLETAGLPFRASKVKVADFPLPDGSQLRGMCAKEDLRDDTRLCEVPYSMFLNADNILGKWMPSMLTCLKTKFSKEEANALIADEDFIIGTFLVKTRFGSASAAKNELSTFVSVLPAPEDLTVVETFSEEDIALLCSAVRIEKARRRKVKLMQSFQRWQKKTFNVDPSFFEPEAFTFVNWSWATTIMSSRAFVYTPPPKCAYPSKYMIRSAEDDSSDDEPLFTETPSKRNSRAYVADNSPLKRLLDDAQTAEREEGRCRHPAIAKKLEAATPNKNDIKNTTEEEDGEGKEEESSDDSDDESSDFEDDTHFCLLPFVDMFNHSEKGMSNFGYIPERKCFQFICDKEYKKGDQVFLRYNAMDHWRFAKYYGFVPFDFKNPADAFPIWLLSPPPHASVQRASSVVDITRYMLFEGDLLKKSCYVTSKGPNTKLIAAYRLRYLSEEELPTYTQAFKLECLSVRNEWHCYSALLKATKSQLSALRMKLKEIDANPPANISSRGVVALTVARRDEEVLTKAVEAIRSRYTELSEVLYYGSSAQDIIRGNIVANTFQQLKKIGHIPRTEEERQALNLPHAPLAPKALLKKKEDADNDGYDIHALLDDMHSRMNVWRDRELLGAE